MKNNLTTHEVLDEVRKLQYLFRLKHVTRYNEIRSATDSTESVAEHIYGLQVLSRYFVPLESKRYLLNEEKIWKMILWHDIDEIEVGDILGYKKTKEDYEKEESAEYVVINKSPNSISNEIKSILQEYREQKTIDAKFVKALDKFEPLVHLYNKKGKKLVHKNRTTVKESLSIKLPFLNDFPDIKHFCLTIHGVMEEERFFIR